jgi:signal transduction histidine kinase/ActR/RegA family two-component response regulator
VYSLGRVAKWASFGALLLLALGGTLMLHEVRGWERSTQILLHDYRRALLEGEFHEALTRASGETASYVQSAKPEYLEEAREALTRAHEAGAELDRVVRSEPKERPTGEHASHFERHRALLRSVDAKVAKAAAIVEATGGPAPQLLDEIYADEAARDQLLQEVTAHHRRERDQDAQLMQARGERAQALVQLVAAVLLAWMVLMIRYVQRRVVKPLAELVRFTSSVAQGDLTQRVGVTQRDEIGQLQLTFNQLVVELAGRQAQVANLVESLSASRDAAQSANRAKSEFVARVSHEIRTPMNAIIVALDLLRETATSTDQRELADIARSGARSLLGMLNDLLDLSRIEAGKLVLDSVSFEPRKMLTQIVDLQARRATAKGLAISCEISPQVPDRLRGDPMRLTQIVMNLVDNAIKYTERGSIAVSVATTGVDEPAGRVALRFEVADTGIGIAREAASRVFEPFYQVETQSAPRTDSGEPGGSVGGFGLGLGIARQLARMMDGELGFDSVPGQGSAFWFTAFMQRDIAPQAEPAPAPPRPLLPPGRSVLLVEDNRDVREVMLRALRHRGLEVAAATNGREAFEQVRQRRFDLVLMDCQMPVMDGFEATREIRALGGDTPRVPIVAVTAYGLSGSLQDFLDAGFDDVIAKPYTIEQIEDTLERWLVERRPGGLAAA